MDGLAPAARVRTPPRRTEARAAARVGRPVFRMLRAGLFAVVCVAVSLAVHMLAGGGAVVAPGVLAATVALTAAGAYALAGRQRGFGSLLVACFAAQYGMHRIFGLAVAGPYETHHMPAALESSAHQHGGGLWQDAAMLLLHTMTAVVSAWWLHREECALATLLHLLATSAAGLWARLAPTLTPVAVPECVRPPVPGRSGTATVNLLAATVSRRGPPLGHPVS